MRRFGYTIIAALVMLVTNGDASEFRHEVKASCKVPIHKKDSQKTVIRKLREQMDCLERKISMDKTSPKVEKGEHAQGPNKEIVYEAVSEVQQTPSTPSPKKLQIRYPSVMDEEICLTSPNSENCYNGLVRE